MEQQQKLKLITKKLLLEIAADKAIHPKYGFYYFNPKCKHERCSYNLKNCLLCIEYSCQIEANRIAGIKTELDLGGDNQVTFLKLYGIETPYQNRINVSVPARLPNIRTTRT